ncbi:MAG: tetratricopeptide repeat protein, partial [Muribaculaceae bacterium]|nr:tetratricopeptide repeat protein [Muribaculaceae bacterium]
LCPGYHKTWLQRGVYLDIYEGNHERSCADYREAIRLAPAEVEAYTRLGGAYTAKGDTDAAIEVYRACCVAVTEYPYHHNRLASLLINKGDFDQAAAVMLRGMDMVDELIADYGSLSEFPEPQRTFLLEEVEKRAAANPSCEYWNVYLNLLRR